MRLKYLAIPLLGVATHSYAALEPLSDEQMESAQGQAFIGLNEYDDAAQGLSFTRINLGMEIDIFMNAKEAVFGEFNRNGESGTADLDYANYSMGYIDENREIQPFKIIDPFFELAYEKNTNGTNDIVGFRMGFGDALGVLSMDASSFTGAIDVVIAGDFTYQVWPFPALTSYAEAGSELVTMGGVKDPIRAEAIGISNGQPFNLFNIDWTVNNCELLGTVLCYPLNTFESMKIGNADGTPSSGLFQSFQSKQVIWGNKDYGETPVTTQMGAFFSIPAGSVNITPNEAAAGTPRLATEFIDRGIGRFENSAYRSGDVLYPN